MKIKEIKIKNFKRFTDLTISNIPETAKLVLLIGPNGSGKSSLFDAFMAWKRRNNNEISYYKKNQDDPFDGYNNVKVEFYSPILNNEKSKYFYFRTAYRNVPDFSNNNLSNRPSPLTENIFNRMIENDHVVDGNYQRLISDTLEGVYLDKNDSKSIKELRDELIGKIKTSLNNVFTDLILDNIGSPINNGSFFFKKGTSKNFHYKNLSGGEKSVFDILLDVIIKAKYYDNTVLCIDEPEAHMHTNLQSKFLEELFQQILPNNQLWLSTHSLGMLKKAREIEDKYPGTVAVIDFDSVNFDEIVEIEPTSLNSSLWEKFLKLALDDFAGLISPEKIVLCEGNKEGRKIKDFDSRCYNKIFKDYLPTTNFVSVGGCLEVTDERNPISLVLNQLFKDSKIIRLLDRDGYSEEEIKELQRKNIKVLKRRHIEAYLLDDQILTKLCESVDGDDRNYKAIMDIKSQKIKDSIGRGNPSDDIKSAAGSIVVEIKKLLGFTKPGNTTETFMRDTVIPLITSETEVFKELEEIIYK